MTELTLSKWNWTMAIFIALVFVGCTTKRDGFTYRTYHNTTAHFNGYFNARESIKEGQLKLIKEHEDDYEEILPLFIYGDEETAKSVYPQMERAIEKCSKVIERHNMEVPGRFKKDAKHPTFNKWMDDCYFTIGQAYFYKKNYYKAEELFKYAGKKFKDPEVQLLSGTWMARSLIEREEWSLAKNTLLQLGKGKDISNEMLADYHMVFADFYIRQSMYKEAAEQLEDAIPYIDKKKEKARPTFILAQLYNELGRGGESIERYEAVIRMRPPYEMKFYALINQALAFSRRGGDSEAIKERLYKMLKDDKNIEYRDQIHYALADLFLEERDKETGIYHLEASLETNVDNKRQKAKSFLRLADIYFDDRDYALAQMYYDSTVTNIDETHIRFKDVSNKAESLTDLVSHLNTITEQDSLQQLCSLSPEDLERKVKRIRREMVEELERKRAEEEAALLAAAQGDGKDGGAGEFWPYNDALKRTGKENFIAYWGDRKLEDDWRRSNKIKTSFGEEEEEEEVVAEEELVKTSNDEIPSIEEMMGNLPCDPFEMQVSNTQVSEALYLSGVIYKEKLDDFENAVESWEVLLARYETSDFHPTAMYQLYRTYLFKEQEEGYSNPFCETCNSEYWADAIRTKLPGSDWAKLIDNPDYLDFKEMKEAEEREAYEKIFKLYSKRDYVAAITACNEVLNGDSTNHLLCKYRMLKAISIGYMDGMSGQKDNYKSELQKVVAICPETEEGEKAKELLDLLFVADKNDKIEEPKDDKTEEDLESPYTFVEKTKHYVGIILGVKEGNSNTIKANISDFNSKNYGSKNLKVTSTLLSKEDQIILVKTFNESSKALEYFNHFKSAGELSEINSAGYQRFIISKENYVTLFKTKELEAYLTFFEKNYK